MKKQIQSRLLAGATLLLFYPFICIADAMALGGHDSGKGSLLLRIFAYSFLYTSLIYPLVYFICFAITAWMWRRNRETAARRFSEIPLFFVLLVCGLFLAWAVIPIG